MSATASENTSVSPERSKKRSSGAPRSPNWCMREIRVLCKYIREHSSKILGLATDGPGRNAKKQKHWERVTRLINEESRPKRVWTQVRKKWIDLAYSANRYRKNNKGQADSGCASSDISSDDENLTPVIKEVLWTIEYTKRPYQEFCKTADPVGQNQIADETNDVTGVNSVTRGGDITSESDSELDDDHVTSVESGSGSISRSRREHVSATSRLSRRGWRSNGIGKEQGRSLENNPSTSTYLDSLCQTKIRNRGNTVHDSGNQRFGGPRRQLAPYSTNHPSQWRERFKMVDRLVSESQFRHNEENAKENLYRKEMLEIEKRKAMAAEDEVSVMKETLHLRRQQLEIQKSMLYYLKGISLNLDSFVSQKRHFQDLQSGMPAEKYPSWDMPRTGPF